MRINSIIIYKKKKIINWYRLRTTFHIFASLVRFGFTNFPLLHSLASKYFSCFNLYRMLDETKDYFKLHSTTTGKPSVKSVTSHSFGFAPYRPSPAHYTTLAQDGNPSGRRKGPRPPTPNPRRANPSPDDDRTTRIVSRFSITAGPYVIIARTVDFIYLFIFFSAMLYAYNNNNNNTIRATRLWDLRVSIDKDVRFTRNPEPPGTRRAIARFKRKIQHLVDFFFFKYIFVFFFFSPVRRTRSVSDSISGRANPTFVSLLHMYRSRNNRISRSGGCRQIPKR